MNQQQDLLLLASQVAAINRQQRHRNPQPVVVKKRESKEIGQARNDAFDDWRKQYYPRMFRCFEASDEAELRSQYGFTPLAITDWKKSPEYVLCTVCLKAIKHPGRRVKIRHLHLHPIPNREWTKYWNEIAYKCGYPIESSHNTPFNPPRYAQDDFLI